MSDIQSIGALMIFGVIVASIVGARALRAVRRFEKEMALKKPKEAHLDRSAPPTTSGVHPDLAMHAASR